jgi:hypothetical protein
MPEIEVDALDDEVGEEDSELSDFVSALTDPDTFYAQNSFRVIYQTNNFLLPQVRDLISDRQIINIRPEYQRRLRWVGKQKSRLIESLLLNIPIPPVFLFEGEAARYEVMDGQQRLSAIKEFMSNEFRLTGLDVLWPINGMNYAECPPRIKRGLDRAVVSAVVLLLESDHELAERTSRKHKDIRRFIFERLNTGGTRLNAQELRNAIYPGAFSDSIVEMARGATFTRIWGIPPYTEASPNDFYENPRRQRNALYASMADCQIVLRFFALRDAENIRGSMKGILDRCMEDGQLLTTRLSISLYDAVMITIDRLWSQRQALFEGAEQIRAAIRTLIDDPHQAQIITGRGNTAQSIKDRINLVERVFSDAVKS